MNVTCVDRERIFLDGSAAEWAALEIHAAVCAACSAEVRIWKSISVTAGELRQEWETPYLWTKIERRLGEQCVEKTSCVRVWLNSIGFMNFQWQTATALALVIFVTWTVVWMKPWKGQEHNSTYFLQNSAVNEVERAEVAYQKAIDKLDEQARPRLEASLSPLMDGYREKLLLLDNAIAELRAETGQNPANAHLRRQLLAMYQEKQDTLQEILEAKR